MVFCSPFSVPIRSGRDARERSTNDEPNRLLQTAAWEMTKHLARAFRIAIILLAGMVVLHEAAWSANLADTVAEVKRSVVGVGTMRYSRRLPDKFVGTGFVVAQGRHVITTAHVVRDARTSRRDEFLAVFVGGGRDIEARRAIVVANDVEHDLSLLEIEGQALAPMKLGRSDRVREGETYAFTGFPAGVLLGMYPATHRGMIASITPIIISDDPDAAQPPRLLRRRTSAYPIFQLDATAYPGNSGSPMYDVQSGHVIAVINKVLLKDGDVASAMVRPSGITYAIPVTYVEALLGDGALNP